MLNIVPAPPMIHSAATAASPPGKNVVFPNVCVCVITSIVTIAMVESTIKRKPARDESKMPAASAPTV